jgi:hypothetical protein
MVDEDGSDCGRRDQSMKEQEGVVTHLEMATSLLLPSPSLVHRVAYSSFVATAWAGFV